MEIVVRIGIDRLAGALGEVGGLFKLLQIPTHALPVVADEVHQLPAYCATWQEPEEARKIALMETTLLILAIGIMNLAGLIILANYHTKALREQANVLKTMGMLKKARDIGDLHALKSVLDPTPVTPEEKQKEKEEWYDPGTMPESVILELQKEALAHG